MEKKLISICVATYKRPELLSELLYSIKNLVVPQNYLLEVIIVDNDKNCSAEPVIIDFRREVNFGLKYFVQPEKNISLTRNVAIEKASGELIAFIDDDETADKRWLVNLYNCLINFNADGVFGLVVPRFDEGISERFKRREYYFSRMDETGSIARYMFTGSVLLKSDLLKKNKIYFDPAYGLTGGEDSDFFNRLKLRGAKFVNCREAISYEFIGKERTKLSFFLKRNMRGGQTYSRNLMKEAAFLKKFLLFSKASLRILIGLSLLLPGIFSTRFIILSMNYLGTGIGELRGIFGNLTELH